MSIFSEEKQNWLDQVKADAEALTRSRLETELSAAEVEVKKRAPRTIKREQPITGESEGEDALEESEDKKGKK